MKPTLDELERLGDGFIDLLAHPADAVARYGLKRLQQLSKAGRIDPAAVVERIPGALRRDTKGPPVAALRLLRRLVKEDPHLGVTGGGRRRRGARPPAGRPGPGVVVPRKTVEGTSPEVAAALGERLEGVTPSERRRAVALLARLDPDAAEDLGRQAEEEAVEIDEALAAARALSPELRILAGVEVVLKAWEGGEMPAAIEVDGATIPRFDPSSRVEPLASLDEVIDCLAALF